MRWCWWWSAGTQGEGRLYASASSMYVGSVAANLEISALKKNRGAGWKAGMAWHGMGGTLVLGAGVGTLGRAGLARGAGEWAEGCGTRAGDG